MAFDATDFSWGVGTIKILPHSSGAGYDSSGEAEFDTLVSASANLGPNTEATQLEMTADVEQIAVHQEQVPVGHYAPTAEATMTVTVSLNTADRFAYLLGFTSTTDQTFDSVTYDTVVAGADVPSEVSILLQATSPHTGNAEYVYAPRCQVDTSASFSMGRELRVSELVLHLFASHQDRFSNPDGTSSSWELIEVTDASFSGVVRSDESETTATWDNTHDLDTTSTVLVGFESSTEDFFDFGAQKVRSSAVHDGDLSTSVTGTGVVFAVQWDDVATSGEGERHDFATAATTWTATAKEFAYGDSIIALAFDRSGKLIIPGSMAITAGAVGAGTVVFDFSGESVAGYALILNTGPNGGRSESFSVAGASSITTSTSGAITSIPLVQFWDGSGNYIEPERIGYGTATDEVSATFQNAASGEMRIIW